MGITFPELPLQRPPEVPRLPISPKAIKKLKTFVSCLPGPPPYSSSDTICVTFLERTRQLPTASKDPDATGRKWLLHLLSISAPTNIEVMHTSRSNLGYLTHKDCFQSFVLADPRVP